MIYYHLCDAYRLRCSTCPLQSTETMVEEQTASNHGAQQTPTTENTEKEPEVTEVFGSMLQKRILKLKLCRRYRLGGPTRKHTPRMHQMSSLR